MSRTLLEIRTQIKDDLDLHEETFVDDTDINRFINQAIQNAEAEIHTLYEDYFLSPASPIAITQGVSNLVDYPSDIYANKIRKILFKEGTGLNTASHEVRRERDVLAAETRDSYNQSATPRLTWVPVNDATTGRKIRLYPQGARDGFLYIYYIRNAAQLSLDTDICDIDEFEDFIVQAVKTQIYLKDGDPRSVDSKGLEEQLKKRMVDTLSNMTPDNNDEIDLDLSHYNDMVGGDW